MGLRRLLCLVVLAFSGCDEARPGACAASSADWSSESLTVVEADVDGTGLPDRLVTGPDRTMLYRACDEDSFELLLEGSARVALRSEEGGWSSIYVNADAGDPWLKIGDKAYRFDRMPFETQIPQSPPLRHDSAQFSADLPMCDALKVSAPLYSDLRFDEETGDPRLSAMTLNAYGKETRIDLNGDESYRVTASRDTDGNGDDATDLLVLYEDRYGSGQETQALLMLGCGNGSYVMSGTIIESVDRGFSMEKSGSDGFVVAQDVNDAPYAAYRVDPITHGLRKIDEGGTEASMADALKKP